MIKQDRYTLKLPNGDTQISIAKDKQKPLYSEKIINALKKNPFLGSDYHFKSTNFMDTVSVLNKYIRKEDEFIILGDLESHHEFPKISTIKKFVSNLLCDNIYLIIGNNDSFDIKDYIEFGFLAVDDKIKYKNITITHCPITVPEGELNIHGHIHGMGKKLGLSAYWFADGRRCFDVYNKLNIPIRLNTILKNYK